MSRFMLLLFFMVCFCSHASSFQATSITDGSQAQCEITGISHTQGTPVPVALGVRCGYQTQNNRKFALALGSSSYTDVSVSCNGLLNMPSSPLGKVISTTSATETDVSSLYPLGYLFNAGAGQVLCQIFFNKSSQMMKPGVYVAGLFSDFHSQPDVWETHGFVSINNKTVPADVGAIYCSLLSPQNTIDMGIIKPNSESKQVKIEIGVSCSGATSKMNTELGYSVRFSQFSCSSDCSLLGEYVPYPGGVADPGDDPETGFTMNDVMPFQNGQTVNTKTYTTLWKIRDNTGNPRDITAKAFVGIYYY